MCHFPYLVIKSNVPHRYHHLWPQTLFPKHAYSYRTANRKVVVGISSVAPSNDAEGALEMFMVLSLVHFVFTRLRILLALRLPVFIAYRNPQCKLTDDRISLRIIKCFSSRQNLSLFSFNAYLLSSSNQQDFVFGPGNEKVDKAAFMEFTLQWGKMK